jgi:branched-chain amino acid transport system permease protein
VTRPLLLRCVALFAVLAVLAAGPWWLGQGHEQDLIEIFTLLALAEMWNLLAGYAGLVSIGQQAFIGIGAFAFYVLADDAHIHPFAAVALAGLVAMAFAIPTAALSFRLRGGYFAIGTWVIAEVYHLLTINLPGSWFGNADGVTILSAAGLDRTFREHGTYFWALAVGVGSVLGSYLLLRSRIGLALTAIRDDEDAARASGVDVLRTKVIVYLIAALGTGLAGGVIYLNLLRVQPDAAFDVNWSAQMIFIVVIGGIGTIEGPIIGTIVFFTLQQELSQHGSLYLIIVGGVAMIAAVWLRGGLWGTVGGRVGRHLFPVQRRAPSDLVATSSRPGRSR